MGLSEREAARFIACSRGHENAGEALAWVAQEAITLMQQGVAMSHGQAVEKIFRLLNGWDKFQDGDFELPKLSATDTLSVMEGAQALCAIMLHKMHPHSGN